MADVAKFDELLEMVWDGGATDLLLTCGAPPLVRVDGELVPLSTDPLTEHDTERLTTGVLNDEQNERFRAGNDIDFAFSWRGLARFRGNAFHQRGNVALSLRLIPYRIPSFGDLGAPPAVETLVQSPHGLVLVTGPTGAGKSTTLAAMIDWINENRACHILTIEDPIEYIHTHKRAAVNQREIGQDTESWERALKSALREDPDVLLVGEMRDPDSIATTLTIAETGHLVFATLHTNDSAQALDRIISVFPADRRDQIQVQLASTLRGVVYQRLLPRIAGGMVAAYEVLLANHAVQNLLREGKTRQLRNVLSTHQSEGMQTLEMSLSGLVAADILDYELAKKASLYPREVEPPGSRHHHPRLAVAGS
jgi:twitching motility protein PilT